MLKYEELPEEFRALVDRYEGKLKYKDTVENAKDLIGKLSTSLQYVCGALNVNQNMFVIPDVDGTALRIDLRVVISRRESVPDYNKRVYMYAPRKDGLILEIVSDFYKWLQKSKRMVEATKALVPVNELLAKIQLDEGLSFRVSFEYSDKYLVDITDTSIVFGLSDDQVNTAVSLPVFTGIREYARDRYYDFIVDALKGVARPYELMKSKARFIKDMGLYTRVGVVHQIRKTVTKQAKYLREGIGYVDDGNAFALVDSYYVTNSEANALVMEKGEPLVKYEFKCANKHMQDKQWLVKYYRLSPFNKVTLESEPNMVPNLENRVRKPGLPAFVPNVENLSEHSEFVSANGAAV